MFNHVKSLNTASFCNSINLVTLWMLIAPKCVLWLYSEDPDEMLHYEVFHHGLIYTIC